MKLRYRRLKGKETKTLKARVLLATYQLLHDLFPDRSLGAAIDQLVEQAKSAPSKVPHGTEKQ